MCELQTYHIETIITPNQVLTLRDLPFRPGEKVEVIILSKSRLPETERGYALRGQPVHYDAPHDPVAEDEWDAAL